MANSCIRLFYSNDIDMYQFKECMFSFNFVNAGAVIKTEQVTDF